MSLSKRIWILHLHKEEQPVRFIKTSEADELRHRILSIGHLAERSFHHLIDTAQRGSRDTNLCAPRLPFSLVEKISQIAE